LISSSDVKRLIADGEGQGLEFKRSDILSNPVEIAIALTAFANTNDGVVLVGVNDDGTLEGMTAKRGHQELIMNVASDRCVPPVRPLFGQTLVDGKLVYTIRVEKSNVLHGVKFKEHTALYRRVGSEVRSFDPSELTLRQALTESDRANISDFELRFSSKLDSLLNSIQQNGSYEQTDHLMNEIVMLLKERIDAWDEPSVRYGTQELFRRFYALSEKEAPELYDLFKDLFSRAYRERKRLLEAMIWTIKEIMMNSWAPEHNVVKAERASKLLLKLGIDFFHTDLSVTELCGSAIDDLASDFFQPEILSKEILLAGYAYEETRKASTEERQSFVEQLIEGIRENDELAWDALYKSYFIDSLGFALAEKEIYRIDLREITFRLYSSINRNINQQIQGFADFLQSEAENGDVDYSFSTEELVQIILAYESIRPEIARDIQRRALGRGSETQAVFTKLIDSSILLRKIFKGTDMITTFDEMVTFLETNSDFENAGVGVTAYGVTIIHLIKPLAESDMQRVKGLADAYEIKDLELDREELVFEIDALVSRNGQNDMRRVIAFLRDLNAIAKVRNVSTGITFDLRKTP
jgi:hypothetical protein